MSIECQGHFFTIYFPGVVCFVLYYAKISGERLQDHWSSGFKCFTKYSTHHSLSADTGFKSSADIAFGKMQCQISIFSMGNN